MSPHITLLEALVAAVRRAGQVDRGLMAPPAAVLWPDAEGHWKGILPRLLQALPELLVLGPYQADLRQGPAIWLKWVLAGRDSQVALTPFTPVIYLPGTSRSDLRAIESCPRDLQPLAELQYRGVFFSQANAKDWTINAFLVSKQGGQKLPVAQDRGTQEALARAVVAAGLFDLPFDEWRGRTLDEAFFNSLLAPRPELDALEWLADPLVFRQRCDEAHWAVFRARCQKELAFDPETDAVDDQRQRLCLAQGGWKAIWVWYAENHYRVPALLPALMSVDPPKGPIGLFDQGQSVAYFPRANAQQEEELREKLQELGQKNQQEAARGIEQLERTHGARRDWLWADLGESALARALEHLATAARLGAHPISGNTPEEMASRYREEDWKVDYAAMRAIAAARSPANRQAVMAALASIYAPWLDDSARRFQDLVRQAGGLGGRSPLLEAPGPGTCMVFVDGLRFDVAMRLGDLLESFGKVTVQSCWTTLPSVTASGKAWVAPIADLVAGRATDTEFAPGVAATSQDLNSHHFERLLQDRGIQRIRGLGLADAKGRGWFEIGDLDHHGHEHGLGLARDLDTLLGEIVGRLHDLIENGWKHLRLVTDHGWLLVPGGLPVAKLPVHQAETRWGRCATLKASAHDADLTFNWSWCPDVRIAFAPGISSYRAGEEYSHGGLSLQESLVPVLDLVVTQAASRATDFEVVVTWQGMSCRVEAAKAPEDMSVDIRKRHHDPATTVLTAIKPLKDGKVRVLVGNPDLEGDSATVVLLDPDGNVIKKVATLIGNA